MKHFADDCVVMFRDGECSVCGEDGIARFSICKPHISKGMFTFGDPIIRLCGWCERFIIGHSEFKRVGEDTDG